MCSLHTMTRPLLQTWSLSGSLLISLWDTASAAIDGTLVFSPLYLFLSLSITGAGRFGRVVQGAGLTATLLPVVSFFSILLGCVGVGFARHAFQLAQSESFTCSHCHRLGTHNRKLRGTTGEQFSRNVPAREPNTAPQAHWSRTYDRGCEQHAPLLNKTVYGGFTAVASSTFLYCALPDLLHLETLDNLTTRRTRRLDGMKVVIIKPSSGSLCHP